jgi:hypothetical protein
MFTKECKNMQHYVPKILHLPLAQAENGDQ